MVSHRYFWKMYWKQGLVFLNVPSVCLKMSQIIFAQGPLYPVANADFCLCGCAFVEVFCRACNQLISFLRHLLFLVFLKMNCSGIDLNKKCNTAESANFLRHGKKLCCWLFFPLKNKFLAVVGNVWMVLGRTSKGNCCTFILSFLCNSFY